MSPQEAQAELTKLEAEYQENNYGNHRTPEFMGEVEAALWYTARDIMKSRINLLRNRIHYNETHLL